MLPDEVDPGLDRPSLLDQALGKLEGQLPLLWQVCSGLDVTTGVFPRSVHLHHYLQMARG